MKEIITFALGLAIGLAEGKTQRGNLQNGADGRSRPTTRYDKFGSNRQDAYGE